MNISVRKEIDISQLAQWETIKNQLDKLKQKELDLRKEICDFILHGQQEGAKKVTIDELVVTATAKVNYNVDADILKDNWYFLSDSEKRAIKFKPEIKIKEYKKLKEIRSKMADFITVKSGTPTLKVKPLNKG